MTEKYGALQSYLGASEVIDWHDGAIVALAGRLAAGNELATAKRCFEFVRDAIAHSVDIGASEVGCNASEVLHLGHGYCYAKSHLLAALLRANGIPAGFDYQRLDDGDGHFMLHGFNTVWLSGYGWYRIDARGNKPGVDAQFSPPLERLAWPNDGEGELHYRVNLAEPHPTVVAALRQPVTVQQLWALLPTALV